MRISDWSSDVCSSDLCDFDAGFKQPEIVKRRPVVVISPKIAVRAGLCTVVALSTTHPRPQMPYHCQVTIDPPLPPPWDDIPRWVKGDMIYAVGFHRLDLPRYGKDQYGNRVYRMTPIPVEDLRRVRRSDEHTSELQSLMRI